MRHGFALHSEEQARKGAIMERVSMLDVDTGIVALEIITLVQGFGRPANVAVETALYWVALEREEIEDSIEIGQWRQSNKEGLCPSPERRLRDDRTLEIARVAIKLHQ